MFYDVIIIGSDMAGMTAGIYAGRKKINALILTKIIGGQSLYAGRIENYPGFLSIPGFRLVSQTHDQVKQFGAPIKDNTTVAEVCRIDDGFFLVKTLNNEEYKTKTVIVATGVYPKYLGIPGEKKFFGRGVGVCSVCDAPFYKDKIVAVIGGGNSAFDAAYDLLSYAQKIYLLQHRDKFIGDESIFEKLKDSGKVEFLVNAEICEIKGEKFVESLVYENLIAVNEKEKIKEIKVDGVFVNIGQIPNSQFVENLVELNKKREIVVDHKTNSASVPGIFAAGDVTDTPYKQAILAAAAGAKALLSAADYLRKNK